MPIPRLHLVELEDLEWYPTTIRDLATDYLHFMEDRFALHRTIVPLLADALRASGSDAVIDLCSGGGGPVPALQRDLAAEGVDVTFALSDRFPNTAAFQRLEEGSAGTITFASQPVDARRVPPKLHGFRTLFNAFHHFRPSDARAVLQDAVSAGQPIGIFDLAERSLRMFLPLLFTPVYVWIATPFIRPFGWKRLLWTYPVPLVPFTCWWDGLVSSLRGHTLTELQALVDDLGETGYHWRLGRESLPSLPAHVTYLIGYPATA